MDKFVTIDSNGYIKPLQKWIIEAYYKYLELIDESEKQENTNIKPIDSMHLDNVD